MCTVQLIHPTERGRLRAPKCRLCGSDLTQTFVDLGMSPPCESYVEADGLDQGEMFYPLHVRICSACLLVQLPAYLAGEDIFSHYAYFSSYSDSWVAHAKRYVQAAVVRLGLAADSFVVESQHDGYLLKHVRDLGIRCLGIEPAANIAEVARANGIDTVSEFLGEATGTAVAAEHGKADLVAANNVFAHVPDIVDFARGLRALLKDDGTLTIEIPHLLRLIEDRLYDTIYHEHYSYLSLLTTQRVLAEAGLTVVDVEELPTHGGSLRTWSMPVKLATAPSARVVKVLGDERAAGLDTVEGHAGFADLVSAARDDLVDFLVSARRDGRWWRATGRPGRETRCSTTPASTRTCSPTPWPGARSSRACSCPAPTSPSTPRRSWPSPGRTTSSSSRGTSARRSPPSWSTPGSGARSSSCRLPRLEVF